MKVRTVGLVGLGGVARRIHLPAIAKRADLRLVGAAEVDAGNERLATARFDVPRVYRRVDLLEKEKPEIVVVGTPPALHAAHVRASLEAGADVLCEKPFVSTLEEADGLIELARSSRKLLAVNNQYRFMTIYRETERRVRHGDFGEPYQIQVWQQMYHPALVREELARRPRPLDAVRVRNSRARPGLLFLRSASGSRVGGHSRPCRRAWSRMFSSF